GLERARGLGREDRDRVPAGRELRGHGVDVDRRRVVAREVPASDEEDPHAFILSGENGIFLAASPKKKPWPRSAPHAARRSSSRPRSRATSARKTSTSRASSWPSSRTARKNSSTKRPSVARTTATAQSASSTSERDAQD